MAVRLNKPNCGKTVFNDLQPPYKAASFKGCKAILIDSECMIPAAYKGQKVIFSEIEAVKDGDLVYVKLKTGERLFKRLYTSSNHITLLSINPVENQRPLVIKKGKTVFCYKIVGVRF